MEFSHYSVMLPQCMEGLHIKPDGTYIDGTAGGAGHSKAIAERLTTGRLLSFDRDPDAVAEAAKRLAPYPTAEVIHSEFARIPEVLAEKGIPGADGILLDLGVSSYQLDNPERGFAYSVDAPLDMRMSREGMTAAELLNSYDTDAMARIFREFGEERFAYPIAKKIAAQREKEPFFIPASWSISSMRPSRPLPAVRADTPPSGSFRRCVSPSTASWISFRNAWIPHLTA